MPLDPANLEETDLFSDRIKAPKIDPSIIAKLKKTKLGKLGNYTIYAVDDEYIRNFIDLDYTIGGNFGRDAYIPEGEIWISNLLKPSDYAPVLLHEAVETLLMTKHKLEYEHAHNFANLLEGQFRRRIGNKELKIKNNKDAFKEANRLVKQFLQDALTKVHK